MMTDQPVHKKRHTVKIVREVIIEPPMPSVSNRRGFFHRMSQGIAIRAGSSVAFAFALLAVIIWAVTGPFVGFSNTWQLTINTGTTIITFLMVFAIQNTQNRDSRAMQLKLDELIKSNHGARAEFVDIEDLDDGDLEDLHTEFKLLHQKFEQHAAKKLQR